MSHGDAMDKRPEPVAIPEGFEITKLPPGRKVRCYKRRPASRIKTLSRAEAIERCEETRRYADAVRRLSGSGGMQYNPHVIEHDGAWAVAVPKGDGIEIIKGNLSRKQAQRFARNAVLIVTGGAQK